MIPPAERPPARQAAGFVLAGGQSSRMGSDKALLELGGKPLIVRALEMVQRAGLSASIAGARSALSAYAPVIDDPGLGPLGGLCAALRSTPAAWVVFVPVDMPLLPPRLLQLLLDQAQFSDAAAVIASVNGFPETFPAVVHCDALPSLENELETGPGGCIAAFRAAASRLDRPFRVLAVENLIQAGQMERTDLLMPAHWFLNANTPAELRRAQSLLPSPIA